MTTYDPSANFLNGFPVADMMAYGTIARGVLGNYSFVETIWWYCTRNWTTNVPANYYYCLTSIVDLSEKSKAEFGGMCYNPDLMLPGLLLSLISVYLYSGYSGCAMLLNLVVGMHTWRISTHSCISMISLCLLLYIVPLFLCFPPFPSL